MNDDTMNDFYESNKRDAAEVITMMLDSLDVRGLMLEALQILVHPSLEGCVSIILLTKESQYLIKMPT